MLLETLFALSLQAIEPSTVKVDDSNTAPTTVGKRGKGVRISNEYELVGKRGKGVRVSNEYELVGKRGKGVRVSNEYELVGKRGKGVRI